MGTKVETVYIRHLDGFVRINQSDFDPSRHQLVDPSPEAIKKSQSPPPATFKIDINSASLEDLMALPNVGGSKANKIIDNRPYVSIADVFAKAGVNLEKIADSIEFGDG